MEGDRSAGGSPRPPKEVVADIGRGGRAAIALSGGVDSAVVAELALEALGDGAVALTFAGPAVASAEVRMAKEVAEWIGIAHEVIRSDPLEDPMYRANPSNRCYFCRRHEAGRASDWGASHGVAQYLDGVHVDDTGEDRPGLRALDEAGFVHPLLRAGWRKADVRAFARSRGLPNFDRPSDACLASRIRHGEPVTVELLARIARAEELVRSRGFRRVRVRSEGPGARLEVDPDEVVRLSEEPVASELLDEVGALGFARVRIDPRGYRWRPAA